MSEPKPLFGKDDAAQIEKIKRDQEIADFDTKNVKHAPKGLVFPDRPITPSPAAKVKPLDLSNVSVSSKAHVAPNPGALFADTARPNSTMETASKIARTKFANLGTNLDSVDRQMKQLVPLSISTVVIWGEPGITEESALVTRAAGFVKSFSDLRGNELVETALTAATNVKTAGFFGKLMNNTQSVIGYKPNLQVLKTNLLTMLPQCDEFIDKIEKAHLRVAISCAALSSVCEAVGDIQDTSLSMAVDNRRRILTQCVQQCDLTEQQLKQVKTLIVEQLSRTSQMLDVTIPAFETAHATR